MKLRTTLNGVSYSFKDINDVTYIFDDTDRKKVSTGKNTYSITLIE